MFHLNKKYFLTLITVILGAFVQAYVIKVFIQPANLLSSGFTGVAILIEKITSTYFHFSFSIFFRNDCIKCTSSYFML